MGAGGMKELRLTPAELSLLQHRLAGAVSGLAREMDYRRHPLTTPAARDQRFNDVELTRMYLHYRQLATLARTLAQPPSLLTDPPPSPPLGGEMLAFLADELALTHAAAAYVDNTPFNLSLRRKLRRALAVEARFFQFLLDEAASAGAARRH
jgi:hypothetical protein